MLRSSTPALARVLAAGAALLAAGSVLATVPPARAGTAPAAAPLPATASADGLPTTQIDGVGWSQAVVGDTVYVGGAFTTARPAGAAPGTQEVPRHNLLAYDITTGVLVPGFDHDVNGQVLVVRASPDGSRLYVGGDFTSVDGQPRNRVAAFDTRTGALVAGWAPSVNSQVRAIAATGDTVYLGGSLTAVGGISRSRLAAVSAAGGALLPWAPVPGVGPTSGNRDGNTATSDEVLALVLTGGGTQVVASGRFDSMNGVKATGVAALDAATGATRPFAVNQLLTNQGINSAVYSLVTDGTVVVGTGYDFNGPGNLEGSFTVTADTGRVLAVNDCHGDHYGAYASGGVVYFAGHAHDCSNIGGFPEQQPRLNKFATAVTVAPAGTVGPFTLRSDAFYGKPAPAPLDWFPTMSAGSVTGQLQAGWSITGDGRYLVYAGEFPRVNGVDQQGLVRYALPGTASPHAVGPSFGGFTAAADSPAPGTARITWDATWDPDDRDLTYRVVRDAAGTTPLHTTTAASTWWSRPTMSFTDPAAAPGSRYRVEATDAAGNRAFTAWVAVGDTPVPAERAYVDAVRGDGAIALWSMGDPAGTSTAASADGAGRLAGGTGASSGAAGALAGDPDTSFAFDGTPAAGMHLEYLVPQLGGFVPFPFAAPETTTAELWFATTATTAGELFGFGTSATGDSATTDRTVTIGADGRLTFSVLVDGEVKTVTSPTAVNDGRWHSTAATLSPAGMFLYVDGALVASRNDTPAGLTLTAHLRVGGDAGRYFAGRIDEVALYTTAPRPEVIARHFAIGSGAAANAAPTAAFTAQPDDLGVRFDGSTSADRDGTVAGWAWDFGDGTSGSGAAPVHTYAATGTYSVTLTVTDDDGSTGSTAQLVTVAPNTPPTTAFTSVVTGLSVAVDGTGSADPDGRVASYAWNWGDGGPAGSGATATHAYAAAGTYQVALTVTDDRGAQATTVRPVTVAAVPGVLASDAFRRTTANGLGTADVGGPWLAAVGAARLSVNGGAAAFALPAAGNNTGAYLGIAQTASDLRTAFDVPVVPTGNGTYVYLTGRRVGTAEYRVRVRLLADGRVALALSRVVGGTETFPNGEVVVPGLTYRAGATINAHVQTSGTGTTTVRATVWTTGTEPATPQLTRTDTTAALQAPGGVGLGAYRPTGTTAAQTVRFTAFAVTAPGAPAPPPSPVNAAPTAAFTATATGLAVSVDGAGSTDADGSIASYAWNWGDGTPAGSGTRATHTYAAAGTRTVTLTVTDDDGATATATRTVTTTAPQGPPAVVSDPFDRTVAGGLGAAPVGGAWTAAAGPTRQSVTPGTAELRLDAAGQNTGSYLGGISATSTDLRTSLVATAAPTGGGTYVYVSGRRVSGAGEYRVRVRLTAEGTVVLALSRLTGTTEAFPGGEVVVPGLTYTAGQRLNVHVQVFGTGTTTVRASVWTTGAEPAAWQLTRTDTTAGLQAGGGIGLAAYRPATATTATVVRFSALTVTAVP